MRVAVPCPGVGHIRRGYETFALELGAALRNDAQIVVYGARGTPEGSADVRGIPTIHRGGRLARLLVPDRYEHYRYTLEQLIFCVLFAAVVKAERYDVVHVSDGGVARGLMLLRERLGLTFRLVFSNGGPYEPRSLPPNDLCQVLTPPQWQDAVDHGIPEERLALVPYGLDCSRIGREQRSQAEARKRLRLPLDASIVLSVTPVSFQKRLDYLIREIERLGRRDVFLLVVGQPTAQTAAIEVEAARRLPGQHRIMSLPYAEMPWAYQAADLFTLCSLVEGFGRVVLEAMTLGVPTVVHDSPHFQWLVPDPISRTDMARDGALADRLDTLLADVSACRQMAAGNRSSVADRFDWSVLKSEYLRMYEAALRLPPAARRQRSTPPTAQHSPEDMPSREGERTNG